jgi:hypothetical protein
VALTGKDIPEEPIRKGKEYAKICVTVKSDEGSKFIVERRFTKDGGTLIVKTSDGAKFSSPQKFLDEKIGKISFEPFDFIRKQPREQKKFLMELLGIDLSSIDAEKKHLLSEKDIAAKKYIVLKSQQDKYSSIGDELERKDSVEIIEKYKDWLRIAEESRGKRSRLEFLTGRVKELKEELEKSNKELEILRHENLEEPDLSDLKKEIEAINEHNKRYEEQKILKQKYKEKNDEAVLENQKGKDLSFKIKALEEKRVSIISNTNMPIDGLNFSEDGLLFEGLPFTEEQLSTSKLIEVGIKIQMALNPSLRIMRIKDGSLLDSETLKIIKNSANENDYQLFIERVSDSKEIGFIIEEEDKNVN